MDSSKSNLDAGDRHDIGRRRFLERFGWGGIGLLFTVTVPGLIRFFQPQGRHGGRGAVPLGSWRDYRTSTVSTRWVRSQGLWLVHQDRRLFALEARCTHLGCTPRWIPERGVFRCPCHGSRFSTDGVPLKGPATQPLYRLAIRLEHDQVVVDRSVQAPMEDAEGDASFFIPI